MNRAAQNLMFSVENNFPQLNSFFGQILIFVSNCLDYFIKLEKWNTKLVCKGEISQQIEAIKEKLNVGRRELNRSPEQPYRLYPLFMGICG